LAGTADAKQLRIDAADSVDSFLYSIEVKSSFRLFESAIDGICC